jgi:hypothetical protein
MGYTQLLTERSRELAVEQQRLLSFCMVGKLPQKDAALGCAKVLRFYFST